MSFLKKFFGKKQDNIRSHQEDEQPIQKSGEEKGDTSCQDELLKSLIKVDLSFIPKNQITPNLLEFSTRNISNPYHGNENLINDLLSNENMAENILPLIKEHNKGKENFWELEKTLLEFANQQFESENIELAEKCYRYLVEIGSKLAQVKEKLIDIYKNTENQEGLKWIRNQIEEQLNNLKDFHHQKSKLLRLKTKYMEFLYTKDEAWASFNKQLCQTDNLNEHAAIYEEMSKFLLTEKKNKDAVLMNIFALRAEALQTYLMDQSLNSNFFEKYMSEQIINGRIAGVLRKAKLSNRNKEITTTIINYFSTFPNDDFKQFKEQLLIILSK